MIKIQLSKSSVPFDKREMETIRLRSRRVAVRVTMNMMCNEVQVDRPQEIGDNKTLKLIS